MPTGPRPEAGRSTVAGLIALLLVGAGVYVGMKVIPVRAAAFALEDAVREETIFAGSRDSTDEQIRSRLLEVADRRGLPVDEGDIRIERRRNSRGQPTEVRVEVEYAVPIEFVGGYVFRWEFSPSYEAPVIR